MSSVIHFHEIATRDQAVHQRPVNSRFSQEDLDSVKPHRVDSRDTQQVAFRVSCVRGKAVSFVAGQVLELLSSAPHNQTQDSQELTENRNSRFRRLNLQYLPLARTGLPSHTI